MQEQLAKLSGSTTTSPYDEIKAMFDEEIARADAEYETSTFLDWLTGLRDRTLALVLETR